MAFTQVLKVRGRTKADRVVTVAKSKRNNQLLIRMSRDVFEALGSPERVKFFAGTEEDAGCILISASDHGPHSYSIWSTPRSPNLYMCTISAGRLGVDAPSKTTSALFEVTEDGLIVQLPEVPISALQVSQPRRVVARFQSAA